MPVYAPQVPLPGELNAKKYGVRGDATDETATIQALLTLGAGGTVYFPPGTYAFTMLTVPSNTTVRGVRGGTFLRPITNGTTQMARLRLLTVNNVTLRDFTITETAPTVRTGVYGQIALDTATKVRIENVEINQSSGTGIHIMLSTDIVITGCYVHGTLADGIHIQRGTKNVVISNCVVNDVQDDLIGFVSHAQTATGFCENITIVGNTLGPSNIGGTAYIGSGVALIGCLGATVVGNTIRQTGSAGIRITAIDETGTSEGFAVAGNILVAGNRIHDCGVYTGGITGQLKEGIAIYNARNVAITGNDINKTGASGIAFAQAVVDLTISDNTIKRAGGGGITGSLLERNGNYLDLWANSVFDDGRTNTYVALHNITITGNRVYSAANSGITVQGASTRFVDGLTLARNRIRFPNTAGAGGQYGMNTTYIDGLDMDSNDVGDSLSGTAVTKYNRSNVINVRVANNGPVGATSQPSIVNGKSHWYGTTSPTSGTWEVGDVQWNSTPTSNNPQSWTCKTAGTMGTLNSGATTGSITSGTTQLTVSSTAGVIGNVYITIAGVTGKKKVVGVIGSVLTLDSTADATVSAAAVAYSAAAFDTGAILAFDPTTKEVAGLSSTTLTALDSRYNGAATFKTPTGYYLTAQASSRTTVAPGADTIHAAALWLPSAQAFDRIGVEVTTLAAASTVRLAIYNSASNGLPGTLVLDAGTVDSTTTGVKLLTISNTLVAGMYWLAAKPEGGSPTLRALSGLGLFNPAEAALATTRTGIVTSAAPAGAFASPATTSTGIAASTAMVILRAA